MNDATRAPQWRHSVNAMGEAPVLEAAGKTFAQLGAVLNYMVGDRPTIADFSLAGYVFYPVEEHGYDWATSHPNVHAWTERLRKLPGWKAPYNLMPGTRIKPVR
jgi:glutathione S-transferase